MRNQKKIVIEIDENGSCSIEGEGFVGPECSHFMDEIEESLGKKISEHNKPEYRQTRTTKTRGRQLGGR